jgi:hypothetical protein
MAFKWHFKVVKEICWTKIIYCFLESTDVLHVCFNGGPKYKVTIKLEYFP